MLYFPSFANSSSGGMASGARYVQKKQDMYARNAIEECVRAMRARNVCERREGGMCPRTVEDSTVESLFHSNATYTRTEKATSHIWWKTSLRVQSEESLLRHVCWTNDDRSQSDQCLFGTGIHLLQ